MKLKRFILVLLLIGFNIYILFLVTSRLINLNYSALADPFLLRTVPPVQQITDPSNDEDQNLIKESNGNYNANALLFNHDCNSVTSCEERLNISEANDCQSKIQPSLNLLEEKTFDDYYYVIKWLGTISCQDKGSGVYVWNDPADVVLGQTTINAGNIWLASVFVHEARHVELYRQYIKDNPTATTVPESAYAGEQGEQICLNKQYDALVKLGADQNTLDYVKNDSMKTKWWEVDYENRSW